MARLPDVASLSVLIVDDDQITRTMVARMLANMGIKFITQAENGVDAIKIVRSHRPNIVLCDIEMEPMSGIQVLEALRHSVQWKERGIPLIFLTNRADSEVVAKARELGVSAFLLKPVTPERLRDRIIRAIESTSARS